jgi:hypothetical protein
MDCGYRFEEAEALTLGWSRVPDARAKLTFP